MVIAKLKESVFFAGMVLGLGAAMAQAFFKVIPPIAYGVCMVCHPKELFNWLADHLLGTHWGYSMASTTVPLLTVVGVVVGALIASRQHGEFHFKPARQPLLYFVAGFLMINFGLILGSCPIRVVLLTSYGSIMGLVAWVCVVAGVGLGLLAMRWRAGRTG
jgi:hypothetical protein